MTDTDDTDDSDKTAETAAAADAADEDQSEETSDKKPGSALREGAILVTIALVLYYVMLTFIARPYLIPSESMEPTLHGCPGCTGDPDHGRQGHPASTEPRPGDVVVFKGPPDWNRGYKSIRSENTAIRWMQNALSVIGIVPPDENDLVKRVIATGGQTVECRVTTGLTVDGKKLNEPYLNAATLGVNPSEYPCLGPGIRTAESAGRQAVGDGGQPHPFIRFAGALRKSRHHSERTHRLHRRPRDGNRAAGQRDRKSAVHRLATRSLGWGQLGQSARVQRTARAMMLAIGPPRTVIRRSAGLRTLESALYRNGLGPVAGVDEVGRGACAGPLVVAACVLGPIGWSPWHCSMSSELTEKQREQLFPLICRYALAYHVVFIPTTEVDRRGVHVANIEGMRRAVAGLSVRPGYVLSDGFRVPGLSIPSLPVIGGDGAAACIAAASVLAKVSRDRLMVAMDQDVPGYGFAVHKRGTALLRTRRR